MPTTLTASPPITFLPAPALPRITKLGCVGMGEVVHTKLWPAVHTHAASLTNIVVCSREPHSRLERLPHLYHAVEPDGLLPLDALEAQGFLEADTLWIIATPSACHALYALQVAGRCRVALEKPLAATSRQARRLLPAAHQGAAIYPIDHKLFNASALAFIAACRQRSAMLAGVGRIAGIFYEPAGLSQGRHQEDCIADVQGHLFTPVIAAYRATGACLAVTVDRVWVASHAPDPVGRFQVPTVWTASRIQGRLVCDGQEVAYDFRQAKGAPQSAKGLQFYDREERLLGAMDLNETGWHAHARVLEALIQPVVDMRHTLEDAVAVLELLDASRSLACQEPAYPFGTLPDCLQEMA